MTLALSWLPANIAALPSSVTHVGNIAISALLWPAGRGKTLSARRYAAWDRFEALPPVWRADDDALATFGTADTVFYTPQVVNGPGAVADGIRHLCVSLRSIRDEPPRRAENIAAKARAREEERKRQELLLEADWFAPPPPPADELPSIPQAAAPGASHHWHRSG